MIICIDLKSFYASVECVLRGLNPFTVNLVVADKERGPGSVVLAASPHLKKFGVQSRCRIYQLPKNLDIIYAKPRMKKYIEYATKIYDIYLKYVSYEDIHVYSIDEVFIDLGPYLKYYGKSAFEISKMIIDDIYKTTKIPAVCGIGENMFLAKVALDILAKHADDGIAYLDKELLKEKIWPHEPITDIWGIGKNISKRLLEREYIENCLIKNVIYETEKINGLYSVWNKLYKRSFIGKLKFDESRRTGEDWWFNLYLLDKANSIAVVNEPLYYYSINANKKSLSKEFYTDRIWELVGKYHDFLDFFKKYNIPETDINTNRLKVIINELVKARLNLTDKAFKMHLAEVVKNRGIRELFSVKNNLDGILLSLVNNINDEKKVYTIITILAIKQWFIKQIKSLL